MLKLKRALVESFVGAIALGWLLSDGLTHLANVIVAPIAKWIALREMQSFSGSVHVTPRLNWQDALPEIISAVIFLLITYGLLRWLYYKPLEKSTTADDAVSPVNSE